MNAGVKRALFNIVYQALDQALVSHTDVDGTIISVVRPDSFNIHVSVQPAVGHRAHFNIKITESI